MNIEKLIKKIQADKTTDGSIPDETMNAITGLVSRLEGMLPDVETARDVAAKVKAKWPDENPQSATLAWAWTIWPLYYAGRIGEILPVVIPLLPKGQPFGQSEIDTVYGEALLAERDGDEKGLETARRKGRRMRAHNLGMN